MDEQVLMKSLVIILAFSALLAIPFPGRAADAVPQIRLNIKGFLVEGENPLSAEQTRSVLNIFLGDHEGLEGLVEAAAELESAIVGAGHSFHRVILPPQTLDGNQIRLQVIVLRLANIEVTGNQHFQADNIRASLPGLAPGTAPDTEVLTREIQVANEHPAKQLMLRLKQSDAPDSVDAEIAVQDRRPWQIFSVLNNTGTEETGEFRLSAGLQHSNLLNRDDTLTLSYTTSPDHFEEVQQYGINYRYPLYGLSGNLSFFYSHSDVDSGVVAQVFEISGAGDFFGAQFRHTFRNFGSYRHRLTLGLEDRYFENNIDFSGTPVGIDVRTRPWSLQYGGDYTFERSKVAFYLGYLHNLPGGGNNNDAIYSAARSGAVRDWEAVRYGASLIMALPRDWSLNVDWIGQYAAEPLVAGEQFGLGGVDSIRGFGERVITGDSGNRLRLAVWTPQLAKSIRLLGFLDAGQVDIEQPAVGQIDNETLISLGLGLRWQWHEQWNASLDYGHEINKLRGIATEDGEKVHFSIFFRY